MAKVFSFSVPDSEVELIQNLDQFRETGNFSKLMISLLRNYFSEDNNGEKITKDRMRLIQLEQRLKEFEEWKEEALKTIDELKAKFEEREKTKREEEDASLIAILRETKFADFIDDPLRKLEDMELMTKKIGKTPRDAIMTRLNAFALENKIPLGKVKRLFFKAFPELEGKINL